LTPTGKEIYSDYCSPDETIDAPQYESHFTYDNRKLFFRLEIAKIIGIEIPVPIDSSRTIMAKCEVKHTPMKWNYWHYSIHWYIDSERCYLHDFSDKELGKSLGKRISSAAKSFIADYAKISEDEYFIIEETCYKKAL
jgi:hypothetical protein